MSTQVIRNYHFQHEFWAKGSLSFETFYMTLNSGAGLWRKKKESKVTCFTGNDFWMAHKITEHVRSF